MTKLTPFSLPDKRPAVWFYLIFNLNSIVIFCFIVAIVLVEVNFNFMEKMTGDFLKWNNQKRERLGRMWNIEQQSVSAMGQLNDMLIEQEEKRKTVETIETFSELFDLLKSDRLIQLTKEQFVKIYSSLPSAISNMVIDPYKMINYFYRSDWAKTFVFQKETGIEIVMVDGSDGVLKSILISGKDMNYLTNFGKSVFGSLEDIEELNNRIYDASEFINALYDMQQEELNKIIYSPLNFLSWGNNLKRVGISEISEDNLVQVGFEIHSLDEKKVVIIYVDDFIISSLIQHLTGEKEINAF